MKNPKQKLKNILLLLTVLFTFSCSKDIYEEELLKEKITKKKITFEEFSSNKKAIKEFNIAKSELQSASFERATYNQDLNIVIDTDNIQLIENDDYKSYTIPFIAEGRENKVDNIVIVEKGNYIDVKFISYNLTKQQLSLMNFGTIDNTILLRNNNAIETECNTIVDTAEIYINPATGQISGYVVTYANPCPGTAGNSYIIQYIDSEGSTGGDGSNGSDFSSGNNSGILNFWSNLFGNNYSNGGFGTGEIYTLGGGGLGGSNTSNLGGNIDDNWDSSDVVTNPVISDINSQNAALMLDVSAYLNHLKNHNTVINQFLTNNSNVYQFIINYVLQNGALTQELKNAINFTLNNIGSVYTTLEQNSNNLTTDELEVLKNKAFQFLIQHGAWLAGQSSTTQQSILQNLTSLEKIEKMDELADYIILNPSVLWNDINESYFSPYPEIENFIDINPDNITYETPLTSQNLPSLASFKNNFPKNGTNGNYTQMSPTDVYNLVGGSLLNSFNNNPNNYSNACSIRGSRGLLYSNIQIPVLNYSGSQRTQKGGDLKNYILDAKSFNKFMIDKFGDTTHKLEGAAANDPTQVMNLLSGKNGIYVIINNNSSPTNGAGYSGHVDLILNGNCIGNEYLGPTGGVKSIRIWTLN